MNDLHKLANQLYKKANDIDKISNNIAITVAKTFLREVVFRTPVDTSKALSNWIVSIGKPSDRMISPHFDGFRGSTRFESAAQTLQNGADILKNKKPGQIIYISNSLDYIVPLNEGSSNQAPAGFVEQSLMVARNLIRNAKVKKL